MLVAGLIFSFCVVSLPAVYWVGYCLLLGWLAQSQIKDIATDILTTQTGSAAVLNLSLSGLLAAPLKIAFVGLIYWMSSIVVRNVLPRRGVAQPVESGG